MKNNLLLLCFLIGGASLLAAQNGPKQEIRLSVGKYLAGSGDRYGVGVNGQYTRYFGNRFKAGLGYTYCAFDNGVYTGGSARTNSIELMAMADVLRLSIVRLELGAGGSYQLWRQDYETGPNEYLIVGRDPEDFRLEPNSSGGFNSSQICYNFQVGLLVDITSKLGLGAWGNFQNGTEGDTMAGWRVGVNYVITD